MRSFFKIVFASLLALVLFSLILFLLGVGFFAKLTSKEVETGEGKSVLTIDLAKKYSEHTNPSLLSSLEGEENPSLYEVIRLIRYAKTDENINGLLLSLDGNANGYAASNELRSAILDFKKSKKFVWPMAPRLPKMPIS